MLFTTAALAAALVPLTSAWGFLGHRTVALLSTRYLLPETAVFVRRNLYKDQTIMEAAVWADRFANVPLGRFSKPWHYIDAMDDPPRSCGVKYNRDCHGAEGCIVAAIVNMTSRVVDQSLPWYQHSQALKWILHFIGDIHQPLHTENLLRGGNAIPVLYHNRTTNLHTVWDSLIIDEAQGGHTDRNVLQLANLLQERIDFGEYTEKKAGWRGCMNTTSGETVEKCAVGWANDSNKYVCEYVLKNSVNGTELAGEYAEDAVEIIRELLAMAGYRLAGWLNTIVTGRNGLEDPLDARRIHASSAWTARHLTLPAPPPTSSDNDDLNAWTRMRNVWKIVAGKYLGEQHSLGYYGEEEEEREQLSRLVDGGNGGCVHDEVALR